MEKFKETAKKENPPGTHNVVHRGPGSRGVINTGVDSPLNPSPEMLNL